MARPSRCRRVCMEPVFHSFVPWGESDLDTVILTVDEYEVIRLVDYEKRTHEQCAAQMEISRTTVTEIYEAARYKISDSLVNGKALMISGGHYRICQEEPGYCCGRRCRRAASEEQNIDKKGEFAMRIAVTYEDGMIFQHFGHTEQVKLYDIENGQIVNEQVVGTDGHGHGALAGFLSGLKTDVLICGGIGGGAQNALAQAGIKLFGGVTGSADEAVKAFLADSLAYNPDVHCDHHGHDHDHHGNCEEGHSCCK